MTNVKTPFPSLHAGMRAVTSAYSLSLLVDYGDARAAERDTYWQIEIDRLKRVNGAELVEFIGIDPVSITAGAHQPMIPDSWRFGFVQPEGSLLRFQRMDSGPLVAWEAVARFVLTPTDDAQAADRASVADQGVQAVPGEPVASTCNCRWQGEKLVQQCTLHEAWRDAIHDWSKRAKAAEFKLAASVASPAAPASPVVPDESVTCERCGEVPETHTANHWCDNQSFAVSVAQDVLIEFDRKLAELWGKTDQPYAQAYGWVRSAWQRAIYAHASPSVAQAEPSERAASLVASEVPDYELTRQKDGAGADPLTALEKYVLENEPAGEPDERKFRNGLAAMLSEVTGREWRASAVEAQATLPGTPKGGE